MGIATEDSLHWRIRASVLREAVAQWGTLRCARYMAARLQLCPPGGNLHQSLAYFYDSRMIKDSVR